MKLVVAPFALLLTGTHGFSVVKPSTSTLLRVATSTPSFSVSTIAGTTATAATTATTAGTQHHRTTGWQLAASASGEEESREAEATSTESADEDKDKEEEEKGEEETSVADEIVVTEEAPDAAVAEATPVVVDFEEPDTVSNNNDEATLIQALFALGSTSGRGEFATPSQRDAAEQLIAKLEEAASTTTPIALDDSTATAMLGKWELVYSNTQLFRSSPFFMAGRAVCTTPEQAQQYDWFCDMHRGALAMSQIGAVRQIISRTRMVSEFEVKAGTIPFLNDFTPFSYSGGWPVAIEGAIVSSADITPKGDAWEIYMDTVEIKGSNLPGLRQVLDSGNVLLKSRELAQVLEDNIASYQTPRPRFTTTYLANGVRISKDDDGKVFVYTKTSEDSTPTDYSNKMADLGVGKLLEGFNDAVTKFYI